MKAREYVPDFVSIVISALLITACLLPGMIPLTPIPAAPVPAMEKNADTVIGVLTGQDWQSPRSLAQEQYTEEDLPGPAH